MKPISFQLMQWKKKSSGRMIFLISLILIIFINGCVADNNTKINSYAVDNGNMSVYFCPEQNCSKQLVDFIDSAEEYVYCAFYDLDLKEVINALKAKDSEGLDIRLVMDDSNYIELDFAVKNNKSNWGLMHNKFCAADNNRIATGSFNPTYNGNYKNNNNLIIINSRLLANNYRDEFNELWNKNFGKGNDVLIPAVKLSNVRIENYFCPDDDCALHIIDEINKANENIYFMTFSFTHDQIANSLALAIERDVDVRGVFEKATSRRYSRFDFLEFQNASVKWDNNSAKMHHKVFIIDNKTVITGSMNPSKSGDTQNDENILIIHSKEIADEYLTEFEKIY